MYQDYIIILMWPYLSRNTILVNHIREEKKYINSKFSTERATYVGSDFFFVGFLLMRYHCILHHIYLP